MSIKDSLYNSVVHGNGRVWYEYERFVRENMEEHEKKRIKHHWLLLKLNWYYRIKKATKPFLYPDVPLKPNKVVSSKKTPYLDGCESEITNMPDPISLASKLLKYDVISFDIFDTLVFRPFAHPVDTYMILGQKIGLYRYSFIRQEAEKRAREKKYVVEGTREVNIDEIYQQMSELTGISADELKQVEIDMELNICFANPYMKQIFDLLVSNGKTVILISDMYLPHELVGKILSKCGYSGYERIFVSCDYLTGKGGNGDLYKIVKHYFGNDKSYMHIGDNRENDIKSANSNGFDTFYYPNVNQVGNRYRATYAGMSELIGSVYGGIVNAKLHCGLTKANLPYEYGYIYAGIYVVGFVNWLHKKAIYNRNEKILFLARDGDIYRKVYKLFFSDIPSEYVFWSRLPNTRIFSLRNRYDFIERFLVHRKFDIRPMSLGSVLRNMKLEALIGKLKEYGLDEKCIICEGNVGVVRNMLIDHWTEIQNIYKPELDAAGDYFRKMVGDAKKVAIVDVGWAGSAPSAIKYLMKNVWEMRCDVSCYLAGSNSYPIQSVLPQLTDESVETYMFDQTKERINKDYHVNVNKGLNTTFFELMTQSPVPTLSGINEYEGFFDLKFGFAEAENYKTIEDIQDGIMDFALDYKEHTKHYTFLRNISGYDAYIPFRYITNDLKLVKEIFSDYTFAQGMGFDEETMTMEYIDELIKRKGL